ncbi:MAG: hypothetical protein R2860_09985 [Desulfobacterales bacterium]
MVASRWGRRYPGRDSAPAVRIHGKAAKLKAQVKGAMTYPNCYSLHCFAGALTVILVFVIPVFQEMFADFGLLLRPDTDCRE